MKNTKTFTQFKNWVKATCIDTISKQDYPFYIGDLAHAIFSAYYIFKHNLKDSAIDDYITNDCKQSFKTFYNHGINLRFCNSFKCQQFNKVLLDEHHLTKWDVADWCAGSFSNYTEYVSYWKEIVMTIYNYWNDKYENETKYHNSKAALQSIKDCNYMHDYYNLLWYCIKHNLSEEKAYEWLKAEIDKRYKIFHQDNHIEIHLRFFDGYIFKDILEVGNEAFNLYEIKRHLSKFVTYNTGYEWHMWKKISDKEELIQRYYNQKSNSEYDKKIKSQYEQTLNFFHGVGIFKLLKVDTDTICKAFKYLELPGCGINVCLFKDCTYSEYCEDERYCIKEKGEILSIKDPKTFKDIESIKMHLCTYLRGTSLKDIREMYLHTLMFLYLLLKSLDDPNLETSDISYKEFSKPIYKNEVNSNGK